MNSKRAELYRKKDVIGHTIVFIIVYLLRLVAFPYLLARWHVLLQLAFYCVAEVYFYSLWLDEYPYYAWSPFHGNRWTFLIQSGIFAFSLIFIFVKLELLLGLLFFCYIVGGLPPSNIVVSMLWQLNAIRRL